MYSKEKIIDEIRRVAKKLKTRSLKKKDFEQNSTLPVNTIGYYMGSWAEALKEADLDALDLNDESPVQEIVEDKELLQDLIRLSEEYNKDPTKELVTIEGKYEVELYEEAWGTIEEAFAIAKKKYSEKKVEEEAKVSEEEIHEPEVVSEGEEHIEIEAKEATPEEQVDFSDIKFDHIDIDEEKGEKELEDIPVAETHEVTSVAEPSEESSDEYENLSYEQMDFNEETHEQNIKGIPEIVKQREISEREEPEAPAGLPDEIIDSTDVELNKVDENEETMSSTDTETPREEVLEQLKKMPTADEEEVSFVEAKEDKSDSSEYIYDSRKTLTPQTIKPKNGKKKRKIIGEQINFRGLRFAPVDKIGVVYLFGMVSQELGFVIESFRHEYPDCEGRRCFDRENDKWEYVKITFEFRSSEFREKEYNENECDILVCWTHDWDECPLEVLELRSTIIEG